MEQTMARGIVYLTIAQIVLFSSGYAVHVGIARHLGPEIYGLFGVVISVLVWAEIAVTQGIPTAVKKFVAEDYNNAHAIKRIAIRMEVLYSTIILIVFFLMAPLLSALLKDIRLTRYLIVAGIDIPIFGCFAIFLGLLNGLRRFGRQALTIALYSITKLAAIFFFVFLGFSVYGALVGNIVASLVGLLIARNLSQLKEGARKFDSYQIIKFAMPIVPFTLAYNLLMNIDLLCVKALISDIAETGFYTSALTLAKIPYLLSLALSIVLFPSLSKSIVDKNKELTTTYINQTLRLLLMLLLPGSLLVMVTSRELVSFLYSNEYLSAATSLSILIFGSTFLAFFLTLTTMIMVDEPKVNLFIAFLLIPIDVILNLKLIPIYGLKGAAIATTITAFIGMTIASTFVLKRFGTLISLGSFTKVTFASLIIYSISSIYSFSGVLLFFNYIILLSFYFIILYLMKEIGNDDLERLRNIFARKRRDSQEARFLQ